MSVSCAKLPKALEKASAGEVITLGGRCTGPFPYKLPEVPITLAGTPGSGFSGGKTAQLEGKSASATIEGLIFENANNAGSGGGALSVNVAGSPPTLTLSNDSFINDSGSEGGGARINTATGAVTVTNSTFTGDSATGNGGGLTIYATTANLTGDTFDEDSTGPNGQGGGLFLAAETSTLSGSQFNNDTATDAGGGAEISASASGGLGLTLSGNGFAHNSVADPEATSTDTEGYLGGGLAVLGVGSEPTTVAQSGDTFDSNGVSFKAAPTAAAGAGEAVTRAALQSTGDHFTNNTLQPPSEAMNAKAEPVFGWGAGLSIVECGDTIVEPPAAPTVVSTLADAVVAGNTLISGPSADGAGIYVGSTCATAYTTLQLDDSTVAGNVVSGPSGPIAGISGGPNDVLSLANTIVHGDSEGAELGGFGSLAGVSAAYSDVCSGGSPFPGTGDICADPRLVGPGPGTADVHETSSSPTLEAGSNALIPSGITTDAFGGLRIAGPLSCTASPAPIVDIGAGEFAYTAPACATLHPRLFPRLRLFQGLKDPLLTALSQTARTWREGRLLAHLSSSADTGKKKPPVGTTFSFSLDEPADMTFTFTRSVGGRRVGEHCVAPTKKNMSKHHCTRTVIAGALHLAGHKGLNKVRFEGRISVRKKLASGHSYTVLALATASGKRSTTRTLRFTVAR